MVAFKFDNLHPVLRMVRVSPRVGGCVVRYDADRYVSGAVLQGAWVVAMADNRPS